ncbi:MAG: DUF4340 domain-containing protein [Myxococcota bacterium]
MDKNLISHTAVALVSLVVAYTAWTSPTALESTENKPALLAANLGDLNRVVWVENNDKGLTTRVDVLSQEGGGVAVTVEKTGGEKEVAPRSFPGSKKAEELLASLEELKADRALGKLGDPEREKFGLTKDTTNSLSLYFAEREVEIKVGDEAFGSGSYYVSPPSGDVFLVGSQVLSSLRHGAGVLLDRRAVGVESKEVNRAVLKARGEMRELVHRYPDEPGKAFYADPAEPDARLDQTTAWIERLLRLRTQSLVDEKPAGSASLEIELFGGGESLATLQLWTPVDEKVAYARSSRFAKTLQVNGNNAKRLIDDASAVLEERPE